jgi:CMP-N,N'-diacetyllegionaminic acid synthase
VRACGIIPARGGSKTVPRKNLATLAGKPLIAYTILAAREAESLSDFIVSTDDEEIAAVAREWGADVPFLRPAHLAEDDVPTVEVLRHAARWLADDGRDAPLTVLLQPTSPLRVAGDIDATVQKLIETGADSAFTVCEADTPAEWLLRVDDDRARQLLEGEEERFSTPRQLLPPVYRQNGAVEVYRTERLLEGEDMYGEDARVVIMPRSQSIDIDDRLDLERAEAVLARRESPGR